MGHRVPCGATVLDGSWHKPKHQFRNLVGECSVNKEVDDSPIHVTAIPRVACGEIEFPTACHGPEGKGSSQYQPSEV